MPNSAKASICHAGALFYGARMEPLSFPLNAQRLAVAAELAAKNQ